MIVLFLLILAFYLNTTQAGEISAQIYQASQISSSDDKVNGWQGLQVSYRFDNDIYVFGSTEDARVYPRGHAWDYGIDGLGIGIKKPVHKYLNVFGQIGYYFVSNSYDSKRHNRNEGIGYYLNGKYSNGRSVRFDEYSIENDNTIAGAFGLELVYPITKSWTTGVSLSYRLMKIRRTVRGYRDVWDYDKTGEAWEDGSSQDYSSLNLGIYFAYRL
jgi:hypothetical protein